jgi:hypothetical protein
MFGCPSSDVISIKVPLNEENGQEKVIPFVLVSKRGKAACFLAKTLSAVPAGGFCSRSTAHRAQYLIW